MTAAVAIVGIVLTEEERARAARVRAWAELPENLHVPDARTSVEMHGVVLVGIRCCYSISWIDGVRTRVMTFSVEGPALAPEPACWAIAVGLFGFVADRSKTAMVMDPVDPTVRGFAQKLAGSPERPS